MEFPALLEELGTAMGITDLKLDADGQCALLFDGEYEVTFTPNKDDHALIMHCEVGDLPPQDNDLCHSLMQASLLGAETGGAALSIHNGLGKIILWKRHDDNFTDLAALEKALNVFLEQAIYWKKRLAQDTAGEKAVKYDTIPQDTMNNFGMFV